MSDVPPTLRWDVVTARWVVLAPARIATPRDVTHRVVELRGARECPFCPGGEDVLGELHWEERGLHGEWLCRAVANKFPMVSPGYTKDTVETSPVGGGVFRERRLSGIHEVLIESPEHTLELPEMTREARERVVKMYVDRVRVLAGDERAKAVVLFKNRGPRAGGSLRHPHAQVMTFPVVPSGTARRDRVAARYYSQKKISPREAVCEAELSDGRRVVYSDKDWMVFNPFASHRGWETWITPRFESRWFGVLDTRHIASLSGVLADTLRRLGQCTQNADYNIVLRQPARRWWSEPWSGWHFEVIVRRGGDAGFELSAETHCAVVSPESAAEALRSVGDGDRDQR